MVCKCKYVPHTHGLLHQEKYKHGMQYEYKSMKTKFADRGRTHEQKRVYCCSHATTHVNGACAHTYGAHAIYPNACIHINKALEKEKNAHHFT